MHDTALELGRLFFDRYLPKDGPLRVLDIGSMDVNGTLRSVIPPDRDVTYTGVDLAPGEGVDVVVESSADLPFGKDSFDAVVSTSCLEHDEHFWLTVQEAARVCKPGGFVYLNAPSNGQFHQHPVDCWRFYPDAGLALERWCNRARGEQTIELIESFVFDRIECGWNDAVIVLGKLPVERLPPPLAALGNAKNIRLRGHVGHGRYEEFTEDQRIIHGLSIQSHHLLATLRADVQAELHVHGRPFFSILVAYYQGTTTDAEFERCIRSIGDIDAEVMVMHDGPLLRPVPDVPGAKPFRIYASPERRDEFGHDLRAKYLHVASGCFVLHTNADNEYAPGALGELRAQLEAEPVGMLVAQCDMVGMTPREGGQPIYELLPDGSRDPSKVLRLSGEPSPRPGTVDLMQVALRRGLAQQYGFPGRGRMADGELFAAIAERAGFCRSPILIGRHY